jgi:hypothetical protein
MDWVHNFLRGQGSFCKLKDFSVMNLPLTRTTDYLLQNPRSLLNNHTVERVLVDLGSWIKLPRVRLKYTTTELVRSGGRGISIRGHGSNHRRGTNQSHPHHDQRLIVLLLHPAFGPTAPRLNSVAAITRACATIDLGSKQMGYYITWRGYKI